MSISHGVKPGPHADDANRERLDEDHLFACLTTPCSTRPQSTTTRNAPIPRRSSSNQCRTKLCHWRQPLELMQRSSAAFFGRALIGSKYVGQLPSKRRSSSRAYSSNGSMDTDSCLVWPTTDTTEPAASVNGKILCSTASSHRFLKNIEIRAALARKRATQGPQRSTGSPSQTRQGCFCFGTSL